jgi:hypothetical protein
VAQDVGEFALIHRREFAAGPLLSCPGCTAMPGLSIVEVRIFSTFAAIAQAGLRSTVRGSSTSSSMTSLGNGVAVISTTPSDE